MEVVRQIPAFLAAVLVIAAVPGPAVALLMRRCSVGGFRAGVPIVLGLQCGLYPQFIPHGYPVLLTAAGLGLLQVTLEIGLYLCLAAAIGRARIWFARRRVRRTLDALCGTVLLGLGARVATESQ